MHETDHQIGSRGDVAQLRVFADEPFGNLAEPLLIYVGLRGDNGHQSAHQLDVAVDVAFELGADKSELFADIGAGALAMDYAILVIGKNPGHQRDSKGYSRRDDARAQERMACLEPGHEPHWQYNPTSWCVPRIRRPFGPCCIEFSDYRKDRNKWLKRSGCDSRGRSGFADANFCGLWIIGSRPISRKNDCRGRGQACLKRFPHSSGRFFPILPHSRQTWPVFPVVRGWLGLTKRIQT
jgi:hypothetical protein